MIAIAILPIPIALRPLKRMSKMQPSNCAIGLIILKLSPPHNIALSKYSVVYCFFLFPYLPTGTGSKP